MNIRQRQKAQTRERIKSIAKAEFILHGIEASSTRQISAMAGVSVGAFFVHFPDKLDLIKEIFFDEMDVALTRQSELDSPTEDPTEYLQQIASTLFKFYGQFREFTQIVLLDSLTKKGFHTRQMVAIRSGVCQRFDRVLADEETSTLFADNMLANFWLVLLECLATGNYASPSVLTRLSQLNLPFQVSYQNALKAIS